jgi:hypothetical protein
VNDLQVLSNAWAILMGLIYHSNHVFEDDRARSLLALAKGLVATSSAAQLSARHAAFAQKQASHDVEVNNLMDFAQMIERLIEKLLYASDNVVRPYLEQRRKTLIVTRPATPEGGEVIAAELALIDRLVGPRSVSPPTQKPAESTTSPKPKGRSKQAGAK